MAFQRFPFRQEYKTLLLVKGGRTRIFGRHVEDQPRMAAGQDVLFHRADQSRRHGHAPVCGMHPHGDQVRFPRAAYDMGGDADGLIAVKCQEEGALRRTDGALLPICIGIGGRAGVADAEGCRRVQEGRQARGFQRRPVGAAGGADNNVLQIFGRP